MLLKGLQKLVGYDSVNDEAKIKETMATLQNDLQEAQDQITKLAHRDKENFERRVSVTCVI